MHHLQVPLTRPLYRERFAIYRAFFYISFRVPSKGTLLPVSPGRAPIARDALFPGPSFTYLSNALVKEPPLQVPPAWPLQRELPISRAFFYISLRVHNEQGLLLRIQSYLALKVPGKGAPPPDSSVRTICGERCPFLSLLLRISLPRENKSLILGP